MIARAHAVAEMGLGQVWRTPEQDVCSTRRRRAGDVEIGVHNHMHGFLERLHQAVEHAHDVFGSRDFFGSKLYATGR